MTIHNTRRPTKKSLPFWDVAMLFLDQKYVTMWPQLLTPAYRSFILKKLRDKIIRKPGRKTPIKAILPDLPHTGQKRLVLLTPHLIVAGAERFMHSAVAALHQDGWEVILIKTEAHKAHLRSSDEWFAPYCREILSVRGPQKLQRYLVSLAPDAVWIINSAKGYEALPHLRQHLPKTRVIDTLFNRHDFHFTNYRHADLIDVTSCENNDIRDRIFKRYGDAHHVATIPNGVDLSVFKPQRNTLGTKFTIGFCARLSPIKNAKFMLELARALQGFPSIQIRIAGEGPLQQEMADTIQTTPLSNCTLIGPVQDVASFINQCDVMIVPSLMDGRPNIVMESIACGTPVLASNVGAIPEMVSTPQIGALFAAGDVQGMADTIITLYNDRAQLEMMQQACISHAQTHFDAKQFQQSYVELFQSMTGK